MEQITINLAGSLRKETFQGREHIVVPMTLIIPGVLNGSRGPLLYSSEELAVDPTIWNGVPIVLEHPISQGLAVSARDPGILDSKGLGLVLKARFVDNKLQAEAWFDVENTNRINKSIILNLEAGTPIELSTGLSLDLSVANEGANFNGTPFDFIATNFKPDHLAIILDGVGACSIDDGCGVLVNKDSSVKEANMALTEQQKVKAVDSIIANCGCWSEDDKEVLNSFTDEKITHLEKYVVNSKKDAEATKLELEKAQESVLVANKSFEDSEGNTHTFSSEKQVWESKIAEVPEKEEEIVVNEQKPQTAEEWLKAAPVEVQNTFNYAQEIETREKAQIIEQLIINVSDEAHKKTLIEGLSVKALGELRTLSLLAPKQEQEQNQVINYFGSQGASTVENEEFSDEDLLEVPTL